MIVLRRRQRALASRASTSASSSRAASSTPSTLPHASGQPGQRRQDPHSGRRHRASRRRKSPIVNTSGETNIRVQTEAMSNDDTRQGHRRDRDGDAASTRPRPSRPRRSAPAGDRRSRNRALTGLVVFLVLVVLFIWAYFREWKMSVGAIVALAHDLVITVGVYALSGFEVTPATVTGVLTILGFSLYDTVVVFDKVRENTKDLRQSRKTYAELANLAVNQTLVRSINTSIVALLPVGALLYVGIFQLGLGRVEGPRACPVRRHGRRHLLLDLHRHAAGRAAEVAGEGDQRAGRTGPGPGRSATPTATPTSLFSPTTCRSPRQPEGRRRPDPDDPDAAAAPRAPFRTPTGCPGGDRIGAGGADLEGAGASSPGRPSATSRRGSRVPSAGSDRARSTASSRRLIDGLIRDVPDFPKPGVVFKDITPLLDDHAAFTAVVQALADAGRDDVGSHGRRQGDRDGGARLHPRRPRSPWPSASASCRCASPASCRRRRTRSATRWSTARRPSRCTPTRWHRASGCSWSTTCWPPAGRPRPPPSWSRSAARWCTPCAVLMELSFLHGRGALGDAAADGAAHPLTLDGRPRPYTGSMAEEPVTTQPVPAVPEAPGPPDAVRSPSDRVAVAACEPGSRGSAPAARAATPSSSRSSGPSGPTTRRPTWRCSSAPTTPPSRCTAARCARAAIPTSPTRSR